MFLLIIAIKAAAPHTFLFRDEGKCFFLISLIDPHKDGCCCALDHTEDGRL
jgi:hypothetical protein